MTPSRNSCNRASGGVLVFLRSSRREFSTNSYQRADSRRDVTLPTSVSGVLSIRLPRWPHRHDCHFLFGPLRTNGSSDQLFVSPHRRLVDFFLLTEKRVCAARQPYGIYQSIYSVLFQNAVLKFVQFTRVLHKLPLRVVQFGFQRFCHPPATDSIFRY